MPAPLHAVAAHGSRVELDLEVGHVRDWSVEAGARTLRLLHTAPWVEDADVTNDASIPPNVRHLSGDFFCAPFGLNDMQEGPEPALPHGWPANTPWRLLDAEAVADGGTDGGSGGGMRVRYELERRVLGARVVKEFTLRDGHPFLYQRHVLVGGRGSVPAANHAVTRLPEGGRLATSPKAWAETMTTPLEPDPSRGRFALATGACVEDLARMPLTAGGTADLTRYPIAERHEDFVMLVEAEGSRLGWLAALRPAAEGDGTDALLSLKSPKDYPVTLLWYSNGGRDYAPWNGRHTGVLGIEEARTYAGYGHRASSEPNELNRAGVPTALVLDPDGEVELRTVLGALALPGAWDGVSGVEASAGRLRVRGLDGAMQEVPFDDRFLTGRGPPVGPRLEA